MTDHLNHKPFLLLVAQFYKTQKKGKKMGSAIRLSQYLWSSWDSKPKGPQPFLNASPQMSWQSCSTNCTAWIIDGTWFQTGHQQEEFRRFLSPTLWSIPSLIFSKTPRIFTFAEAFFSVLVATSTLGKAQTHCLHPGFSFLTFSSSRSFQQFHSNGNVLTLNPDQAGH